MSETTDPTEGERNAGDASECEMYDAPGQTCLTAGPQVVAAEGLCGPCAVRELAAAATRARAEALREVNAILAETEWYCDDDHDWRGKVLLIRRLRAALAPDTAGDS